MLDNLAFGRRAFVKGAALGAVGSMTGVCPALAIENEEAVESESSEVAEPPTRNFTIDPSQGYFQWIHMDDDAGEIEGLHERCTVQNLSKALGAFPDITVTSVELNDTGTYCEEGGQPEDDLPSHYVVKLEQPMENGKTNTMAIYLPLVWNGRYLGTLGGGAFSALYYNYYSYSGGGNAWPLGIRNHFATAWINSGVERVGFDNTWGFLDEEGTRDWDAIKMWSYRSHHLLAQVAKAVIEEAYGEPPAYSYVGGLSGGGRSALGEMRLYPEDYDGILIFCPGMPWVRLHIEQAWPYWVMKNEHAVTQAKYEAFLAGAIEANDGKDGFTYEIFPKFDPFTMVGVETSDGPITDVDAQTMQRIYDGPMRKDGTSLGNAYTPVANLVGAQLMYDENGQFVDDNPMYVAHSQTSQAFGWGMGDYEFVAADVTMDEIEELYDSCINELWELDYMLDPDISEFRKLGGKALMYHNSADNAAPTATTYQYYQSLVEKCGSEAELNKNFRLFLSPGGGHGNRYTAGRTPATSYAFADIMCWVEEGIAPEEVQTTTYNAETSDFDYIESVRMYQLND